MTEAIRDGDIRLRSSLDLFFTVFSPEGVGFFSWVGIVEKVNEGFIDYFLINDRSALFMRVSDVTLCILLVVEGYVAIPYNQPVAIFSGVNFFKNLLPEDLVVITGGVNEGS